MIKKFGIKLVERVEGLRKRKKKNIEEEVSGNREEAQISNRDPNLEFPPNRRNFVNLSSLDKL